MEKLEFRILPYDVQRWSVEFKEKDSKNYWVQMNNFATKDEATEYFDGLINNWNEQHKENNKNG